MTESFAVREHFAAYLLPGEKLWWSGQPASAGGATRVDKVLFFCTILGIIVFIALLALSWARPFNPYDPLIVLAFGGCVALFVLPPRKYNRSFRRAAFYAVTDQRVLWLLQLPGQEDEFYAEDITRLDSVGLIAFAPEVTSLGFGLQPQRALFWMRIIRCGFDLKKICRHAPRISGVSFPPFLEIPEAAELEDLLLERIRAADINTFFTR
jgi:hypothetical protein